uniref:Uncharacterized protein n=1 Tax=Lygus hesperus TaxID=30085 RepID=A0A0K8SLE3_LYGHE
MAMAATSDFLTQYKNISNKLKKRFLRKPNAAEPSDQFASLAAQCERFDLPQYAGLSWRAVSRCEAAQGHSNEEAVALMKAGQLYLLANKKSLFGGEEHVHVLKWVQSPVAAGTTAWLGCSTQRANKFPAWASLLAWKGYFQSWKPERPKVRRKSGRLTFKSTLPARKKICRTNG